MFLSVLMQQNHCNAASISLLHPVRHRTPNERLEQEQVRQHRSELQKMPELSRLAKQIEHANLKILLNKEAEGSSESRIQKRHSDIHDYYQQEMRMEKLSWYNPCDGAYVEDTSISNVKPKSRYQILRQFQETVRKEYRTMRAEAKFIKINDMSEWRMRKNLYKFLPKLLKNESAIQLRLWHRDMQEFVAAFDILRLAKLHYDYHKTLQRSLEYVELELLKKHARSLLCEIEIAINATTPPSKTGGDRFKIKTVTLKSMEARLNGKFKTNLTEIFALMKRNTRTAPLTDVKQKDIQLVEPYEMDLKFLKSTFFNYTKQMLQKLRMYRRKVRPVAKGPKSQPRRTAKN